MIFLFKLKKMSRIELPSNRNNEDENRNASSSSLIFLGDYHTLLHHQDHHRFTHVLSCMPLEKEEVLEHWNAKWLNQLKKSKCKTKTKAAGITEKESNLVKLIQHWKVVHVLDTPQELFEQHFDSCADFIGDCLSAIESRRHGGGDDGKVYVHWYVSCVSVQC